MDERSDKDLVAASCEGDRTAYAGLVRRHYEHVFLVCLGVLGNVHDAEDVAQDALIKGFQRIRQLRDGDQFGGWIVAIARNLSINHLRKRKMAEKTLVPSPTEHVAADAGDDRPDNAGEKGRHRRLRPGDPRFRPVPTEGPVVHLLRPPSNGTIDKSTTIPRRLSEETPPEASCAHIFVESRGNCESLGPGPRLFYEI